VTFLRDGICAGRVQRRRDAKAIVEVSAFYPSDTSFSPDALDKLNKDLKAASYHCGTMLSGGEYQMLMVDAPNVPQDELKTAVRWRLKDMLDFHVDDATIDVLDIPIDSSAASRGHSMFAIAARNALIQSRQELFSEAAGPDGDRHPRNGAAEYLGAAGNRRPRPRHAVVRRRRRPADHHPQGRALPVAPHRRHA
jgi:MSHA biogenesis protein MshI